MGPMQAEYFDPKSHDTAPLKGKSNEILYPQFFSSFDSVGATDQWYKIFSFLVSFSPRYSHFSVAKTDSAQNH